MADITMSKDETLELDVIIDESSRIGDNINIDRSDYDLNGLQTHTGVFNPQGTGQYTITVNGQELTVEVIGTNAIPDSGVARYTFNDTDTESGIAIDMWNGNDATINGATTGVSGANQTYTTDEAYSFDGNDDYVQTPISDTFSTFSFAYWVKYDSAGVTEEDDMSTRDGPSGGGVRQRKGSIRFYVYDTNASTFVEVDTGVSVTSGTWYHNIGVLDSSEIRIYVDGVLEGSASIGTYGNGADVRIADRPDGGDHTTGDIDDPRIYAKALSDTEASNLYNTGFI